MQTVKKQMELVHVLKEQKVKLTRELEEVGIRLNKHKPQITIKQKSTGGVLVNSVCKLTKISPDTVRKVLHEYKIHNADVLFKEDCDVEMHAALVDWCNANRPTGSQDWFDCLTDADSMLTAMGTPRSMDAFCEAQLYACECCRPLRAERHGESFGWPGRGPYARIWLDCVMPTRK